MQKLMVHSFKGGSGKTLYSTNLANHLSRDKEKQVLLIETDFDMPAFQSIFTSSNPDIFLNDFLSSKSTQIDNYIYPVQDRYDVIFCDEVFNPSHKIFGRDQSWFSSKKMQLEEALSKLDYDFVIFDTKPGVGLFTINLLLITNYVFIMMRTDKQSIRGTLSLNLIINQIPDVPEIDPLVIEIEQKFKFKYEFIDNVEQVIYDGRTSYMASIDQFILPPDNDTIRQIRQITENILK